MTSKSPFEGVIFDCDGVLVDSEEIAVGVWAEMAAEYGYDLSFHAALKAFRGGEMAKCVTYFESLLGRPVEPGFVADFRARSARKFEEEIQPVPGIRSVLDGLTIPFCVASNGPPEKMDVTLRAAGLWDYFAGRIVSAYSIGSFKPLPDLFLTAADLLGVESSRCAVVEDSLPGIEAGVAADMSVFAICPPEEVQRFKERGARPFSHMNELLGLLQAPPPASSDHNRWSPLGALLLRSGLRLRLDGRRVHRPRLPREDRKEDGERKNQGKEEQ